jgi:hypothetical protein
MQTAGPRLEAAHCKARWLAMAPRAFARPIHALAMSAIEKAWVAMGQPSPMAGFALLVMIELGRGLLRLPAARAIAGASARRILFALAALTFLLAADRHDQARGGRDESKALSMHSGLCDVNRWRDSSGYHFAGKRPHFTVQHQPRRTS